MDELTKSIVTRGDLAHLALFLWATGATGLLVWTLRELVAANRRFEGVDSIAIHSEEFDDRGRRKWDVYAEFLSQFIEDPSPRVFDKDIDVKLL